MNTECLKLLGNFTGEDEVKFLRYVSVMGVENKFDLGWVWGGLSTFTNDFDESNENDLNQFIWDNVKKIAVKSVFNEKDYKDSRILSPFIFTQCNTLATTTRRTSGNTIVYNNQFKLYLEKLAPVYNNELDSFNNVINCYNSHLDGEKPEAIITYVGAKNTDSGLGYVQQEKGYEFFFDVPGADKYYRLITIE